MHILELHFPILGRDLPTDNGYHLFAAISRRIGEHIPKEVAISSVGGPALGDWKIAVTKFSALRVRLPAEKIAEFLPLAGSLLDVGGHEVRLGVPRVQALTLAPSLVSRLVSIKGFTEPGPFLDAANRQLEDLGVSGSATIPIVSRGPHSGLPKRRVLKIKGVTIVGFALLVEGLTAEDSSQLLIHGLGGRRHMGCGIFVPLKTKGGQA